jgi:hypothetical protein
MEYGVGIRGDDLFCKKLAWATQMMGSLARTMVRMRDEF